MKRLIYKFIQKLRKKKIICGDNVHVGRECTFTGNIECGSNVHIGPGARFTATESKIVIQDYVVFGPDVSIYGGNHPMDVIGKHIYELGHQDKRPKDDADVTIEEGVWIGARAIILKGVTIGRGSVIGAGAVVSKDVAPYSIYVGVPEHKVYPRFNEEQIKRHEEILREQGKTRY